MNARFRKVSVPWVVGMFIMSTGVSRAQEQEDTQGMRQYVVAFLRQGVGKYTVAKDQVDDLMRDHEKALSRLETHGYLRIWGPVVDDDSIKEVLIFDAKSSAEADELLKTDPGILTNYFTPEYHTWWGPSTIGKGHGADEASEVFYLAIMYRGNNWANERTLEVDQLHRQHLAHITAMVDSGVLIATGLFNDSKEVRGMFILRASSKAKAEEWWAKDPSVQVGRLSVNVVGWKVSRRLLPGLKKR